MYQNSNFKDQTLNCVFRPFFNSSLLQKNKKIPYFFSEIYKNTINK